MLAVHERRQFFFRLRYASLDCDHDNSPGGCDDIVPLCVSSCKGKEPVGVAPTAYVNLVGVGDVLPDTAAYLDADSYVPLPLEATYQATWASCPEDMREVVARGESLTEEPDLTDK